MKKNIYLLLIICLVIPLGYGDSLFMASNPLTASIFTDKRARTVGDIIIITISETSNTAQKGTTALKKDSSLTAKIKSLFYAAAATPTTATDPLYWSRKYTGSRLGLHNGTLPESNWSSENDFEGDGTLSSSDKMIGTISAMIIEVLPNGNFILEGKRMLKVDGQERNIVISGIVRPEDISADNMIQSKNLADAKIEFDEKGPISRYRKVGLLKRVWDFIGF